MKVFLDTSSLVKLYHLEEGTEALAEFLAKDVDEIWLSDLTRVEFSSALWKKIRTGELNKTNAVSVINCFRDDQQNFRWIPLDDSVMHIAHDLIMRYGEQGLRTLDSIQFACALTLNADDLICLTSDTLLNSFFQMENCRTL